MVNESTRFEGILDGYFEPLLARNPVYATFSGLKSGEGKLGEATLDFEKSQAQRRQKALQALETVSPRELTNEQQLDRLALRSLLLREQEDFLRGRHSLEFHLSQTRGRAAMSAWLTTTGSTVSSTLPRRSSRLLGCTALSISPGTI